MEIRVAIAMVISRFKVRCDDKKAPFSSIPELTAFCKTAVTLQASDLFLEFQARG
jgi:hypothetical protein